jgi:hypothetical protein
MLLFSASLFGQIPTTPITGWTHVDPANGTTDPGTAVTNPDGSVTTSYKDGWSVTVTSGPPKTTITKDPGGHLSIKLVEDGKGGQTVTNVDPNKNGIYTWIWDGTNQEWKGPETAKLNPDLPLGTPVEWDPATGKWNKATKTTAPPPAPAPSRNMQPFFLGGVLFLAGLIVGLLIKGTRR